MNISLFSSLAHFPASLYGHVAFKRIIFFQMMFCLLLGWNGLIMADTIEPIQEDTSAAPVKLYELSNDELVTKTQSVMAEASQTFLAHMRGTFASGIEVAEARQKIVALTIPAKDFISSTEPQTSLETAKMTLEHATERLDTLKNRLDLRQTEKGLLAKHLEQIEIAQSAAGSFLDTLEQIQPFLREIRWRIDDGTLPLQQRPNSLSEKAIRIRQQQILVRQAELEATASTAQSELEETLVHIEQAGKDLIEAETNHAVTEGKYTQELKRRKLEQDYAGVSPEQLLSQIPTLQQEYIWLNGEFNLAYTRFERHQTTVLQIQEQLEQLEPPEATAAGLQVQSIARAEEARQAIEALELIVDYHRSRLNMIRQLQPALDAVIEQAEILESDAKVLGQHVFNMQVLAQILEQLMSDGKIDVAQVPEALHAETIIAANNTLSEHLAGVLDESQYAGEFSGQLEARITESEAALQELQNSLAHLNETYTSVVQTQQWEDRLKELSAQEIAQKFQDNAVLLAEKQQALQRIREEVSVAQQHVEDAQQRFDALQDAFLRLTYQEEVEAQQVIVKDLYAFAGLDLPEKMVQEFSNGDAMPENDVQTDDENGVAEPPETPTFDMEDYQTLLASRVRLAEGKEQLRATLVESLDTLARQFDPYLDILTESSQLAQQHYANAVELKKRLGSKELRGDDLPEGIPEALNQDIATPLEVEKNRVLNEQAHIQHRLERLSQSHDSAQRIPAMFMTTLEFVGKRFDVVQALQKLQEEFDRSWDALPLTEQKSREQAATQRLETDETFAELLLKFLPSERVQGVFDLLHIYYLELLELEEKQVNLTIQSEKMERFIQLSEEENASLAQLIEEFRQYSVSLEAERAEQLARIQIQLAPQETEAILNKFETRTGRRFAIPPPIPATYATTAIEEAAEQLFGLHAQIAATQKWIELFEQRLSTSGIQGEISQYQNELGALHTKTSSLQRRLWFLNGYPSSEISDLSPDERPRTDVEKLRVHAGEIGVLRAERSRIWRQAALFVCGKLLLILAVAGFLHWVTDVVFTVILAYSKRSQAHNNKEKKVILVSLLSSSVNIIIWLVTFTILLSSLGIEVGAILAGLGIGGLAVAMALRETLSNMIAGLNIVLTRSTFRIGDWIRVGELDEGRVMDITWRTTRIQNRLGHVICIPNSMAADSVVFNFSDLGPLCRIEIRVETVPIYAPEDARKIILDALLSVHEVLHDPLPYIAFMGRGESSQIFRVLFSIRDYGERIACISLVWSRLWTSCEQAGIRFASPRLELLPGQWDTETQSKTFTPMGLVQELPLFAPLSVQEKLQIGAAMQPCYVQANETILQQGIVADSLFLIVEGVVGIYERDEAGELLEVGRLRAGDTFGEEGLIGAEPAPADTTTLVDTFLFKISQEALSGVLQHHPDVHDALSRRIHAIRTEIIS